LLFQHVRRLVSVAPRTLEENVTQINATPRCTLMPNPPKPA